MRYAAVIRISEQCSPDDFEWNTYIKEITKEITINDLIEWQKRKWKHDGALQKGERIWPMIIQEME
uniref:Uncharacterized protein n=1 Tax=viral metagenome TaxID=1070528 RepID=A0A6M3LRL8_9ZZZZ